MKIAGIICEYNPFHNGHKYQIDTVKESFDGVVCLMSGSFVQRGDVAVFDKWTRTRAALLNGADLVIELPVRYALSSAQGFASGSIRLFDAMGVIDSLCFGSECESLDRLVDTAKILFSETPEISEKIKEFLSFGMSYPMARSRAYEGIIDEEILSQPNNILALEYIMAIMREKSNIKPFSITRKSVGHHDMEETDGFASATLIREKIKKGEDIGALVPFDYSDAKIYDLDRLTSSFKHRLILEGADLFSGMADVETGLDNRFLKAIDKNTISEMIDFVKTKRYTKTRLQRIVASALLGLNNGTPEPQYIRVLGMTKKGMEILAEMKKSCTLPIVNKVADFEDLSIIPDITATNIAALCSEDVPQNRDFTTSPVII